MVYGDDFNFVVKLIVRLYVEWLIVKDMVEEYCVLVFMVRCWVSGDDAMVCKKRD